MSDNQLPNNKSWDHFWKKDVLRKSKISWSKKRIEQVICCSGIPVGRVLDAGCGSGYFSKMFLDKGWDVVALDYSKEALQMTCCHTQEKAVTVQADLLNDNLSEKILEKDISLVFSDGLFEHFIESDQDLILANVRSVLKESGFIITVVPNRWSPWQLIRPFFMPGIHERPFVLSELVKLHERNGFDVASSGGLNVLPFAISPEFLGKSFGMLLYVVARKSG